MNLNLLTIKILFVGNMWRVFLLVLCFSMMYECALHRPGHAILTRTSLSRSPFKSNVLVLRGGAKKTKVQGSVKGTDGANENRLADESSDMTMTQEDLVGELNKFGALNDARTVQAFEYIKGMWKKTPPISKLFVCGSVAVTLFSFIFNHNHWPTVLDLDWVKFLTRLQVWRPLTAFLYLGPFGINYLLTIHFVWTYMSQLEKLGHKSPEKFFIQCAFGMASLLMGYAIFGISPKYLGHNFSTYLVYLWSRLFEGMDVNMMDLVMLKAELLPWFFCAQTFILDSEFPFADLMGIAVGHLYHYLHQQGLLQPPKSVRQIFNRPDVRQWYESVGSEGEG